MNDFRDLPLGFGMALLQNEKAMRNFYDMAPAQQQTILNQTHDIWSKAQMQAFVQSLAE